MGHQVYPPTPGNVREALQPQRSGILALRRAVHRLATDAYVLQRRQRDRVNPIIVVQTLDLTQIKEMQQIVDATQSANQLEIEAAYSMVCTTPPKNYRTIEGIVGRAIGQYRLF